MKYRVQEEHEMGRVKGLGAVLGATVLLVVVAACGSGESSSQPTTPAVSHGGPVKDYISLVDNLRAAGATVDPAGTVSPDFFAPQGQLLTVNGERVETFEFASAEEADAAVGVFPATVGGACVGASSLSEVGSAPFPHATPITINAANAMMAANPLIPIAIANPFSPFLAFPTIAWILYRCSVYIDGAEPCSVPSPCSST